MVGLVLQRQFIITESLAYKPVIPGVKGCSLSFPQSESVPSSYGPWAPNILLRHAKYAVLKASSVPTPNINNQKKSMLCHALTVSRIVTLLLGIVSCCAMLCRLDHKILSAQGI